MSVGDVLYEAPGEFRVELIREIADKRGGPSWFMAKPFLIQCRVEGVAAVQHLQLSDALMYAFCKGDAQTVLVFNDHLVDRYRMPKEMLEHFLSLDRTQFMEHIIC